jgi:magnesium transporter
VHIAVFRGVEARDQHRIGLKNFFEIASNDGYIKEHMQVDTNRSKKIGMSPGSIVYIGERKDVNVKIQIIDYTKHDVMESEVSDIKTCLPFIKKKDSVTWFNITGIHDTQLIASIGSQFGLHSLVLEDIANSEQRPKIDDYDDYLFTVLKMLYSEKSTHTIVHEQVSMVVAPSYVISFQTFADDVFDPVRNRIKQGRGHIRTKGSDYLAYALIDTIVDNYFKVLEELGDKIEALDNYVISDPQTEVLHEIQQLKREVLYLRKSTWPLREITGTLLKGESPVIQDATHIYLKDVHDHTVQVLETVEIYRDMLSTILDIYLSSLSHRMNEVMKVLTIMATIFIPLTFIAGIYGMNFKRMPELEWNWAYPLLLVIMVVIFIGMLIWFKRKKWIGK